MRSEAVIVVRVDLDSANGEQYDESLFTMVIGNDGVRGVGLRGDYNVYLGRRGQTDPYKVIAKPLRRGRVENHARVHTHVGALVRKALEAVKL